MRDKIIAEHAYIYKPLSDIKEENGEMFTYGYTFSKDISKQNETGASYE